MEATVPEEKAETIYVIKNNSEAPIRVYFEKAATRAVFDEETHIDLNPALQGFGIKSDGLTKLSAAKYKALCAEPGYIPWEKAGKIEVIGMR
jgi:hypothetical protein